MLTQQVRLKGEQRSQEGRLLTRTKNQPKQTQHKQVNDPLDNADFGIVDGMDASPKVSEFSREMRSHTGCDVGEKDCVDKFLLTKGVPPPPSAAKK